MNGCPHKKPYDQLVNEGLNGQSSVRDLPYIGPFFEGRLRRLGFRTVNDLVLHFNRKSAPEIYDGLTRLLQNRRKNSCTTDYHIADVNHCAFASLRGLFKELHRRRDDYRALRLRRKPTFPNLPEAMTRGSTAAKTCSCLQRSDCRRNRTCRWGNGFCSPRFAPGFAGVADYAGQRGETANGLRFVRGWRVPGRAPRRRFPSRRRRRSRRIAQQT